MNVAWAAGGAAIGLPVGAALRGQVFRLSVPYGDPDRTWCQRCTAAIPRWVAIRCPRCRQSLGRPAVLEVVTAAVVALLAGTFAGQPAVVGFAFFGALGVALAAIDISVHRLPDRLTLPAIPVLIVLLGVAAVVGHDLSALVHALLGGLAMAAGYLLLALARPGQLGGGDIKLAALAGLVLGWLGWPAVALGGAAGFFLAALAGLVLLTLRRATLRSQISFGPFLLAGALLAMLAGRW